MIDDHMDPETQPYLINYIFASEVDTNNINMIHLSTGYVVRIWDLDELESVIRMHLEEAGEHIDAWQFDWDTNKLNGIAYDRVRDTFLIAGIDWDYMFEVRLDYKDYVNKAA